MIRLTLNAQSDPEIHLFNKTSILLGGDASAVDLPLPGNEILPVHLKIIEQNGFPIIINHTNDPFVSVNGHPFGKKLLNSGDVIVVHQTTILFENSNTSPPVQNEHFKEEALASLLENKCKNDETCPSSFCLPFEKEVEVLKEEELQKGAFDHYLKELESFEAFKQPLPSSSLIESTLTERKQAASLKEDYLREFDDDHSLPYAAPSGVIAREQNHLYQAWKWILLFIFSLIAVTGAIGTVIYFSVSDKSEAQVTKAAQAVADIAMALSNAQLNHLRPHNQNWADVEFLKNNLQAILQETSSYANQIDAQGQFNCCPYTLRIYTSSDLTRFLLIAQPAPNLLYWLIPQSIIAVDSHFMELRTLKDVKSLNRLLANPDPLDGLNGKEITALLKEGEIIDLTILARDSGHLDFAPPKSLAWIRPGAENFIYNAPRYYRIGQKIVHQAINLSSVKSSSQEVSELKQAVDHFTRLNHAVLYSDQGKRSAILTRQGLTMFAPTDKIMFGYLLFNAQGKIHQVHLLNDEDEAKIPSFIESEQPIEDELIAYQTAAEIAVEEKKPRENEIDKNHPIFLQLHSLMAAREGELNPLVNALTTLIHQELQEPRSQYQIEYQNLSHTYLMVNAKHKKILKTTLDSLFQQYADLPIKQFLAFIHELHLDHLIKQEDQKLAVMDENCQQNMATLLTHIEHSTSLAELDNIVHIAITWLNFDYLKDPNELVRCQNQLRNLVLDQVGRYLLTKKRDLLKRDDKEVLENILTQERLIKPEERDFFLAEFEQLQHSNHPKE